MPRIYDVVGIGNAVTDIVVSVDDFFLGCHGIRKSHCTYLTLDQLEVIKAALPNPQSIPGGVAGNVAHIISALGGKAAFLGKIAQDAEGHAFEKSLRAAGVADFLSRTPPRSADLPLSVPPFPLKSSQVICLTTPDGDRSFASYPGVARTLGPMDLNTTAIQSAHILFFDGYTLYADHAAENFSVARDAARTAGCQICFNPCDLSVIEDHRELVRTIADQTDIFICNYSEGRALFGDDAPDIMTQTIAQRFKAGAITRGAHGAYVFQDGEVLFVPPPSTFHLPTLDSNGAGDHFAAAYLYALAVGAPLAKAGALAQACALDCLSHAGARPLGSLKHLLTFLSDT